MKFHRKLRGAIAALACPAVLLPVTALASPHIISPNSGTFSVNQPLTVQWAEIVQGSNVRILVEASAPSPLYGNNTTIIAYQRPNSGTYTIPAATLRGLCNSLPTNLQPLTQRVPLSHMDIRLSVRSYNNYSGHDYAKGGVIKLKGCPFNRADLTFGQATLAANQNNLAALTSGNLAVEKRVINNSPTIPPPTTSFTVSVECTPGGPNTVLTLTAPANLRQVLRGIAEGKSCKITERPPVVPGDLVQRGCGWTTMYPNGNTAEIKEGDNLSRMIVNTWSCKPGAIAPDRQQNGKR